MNKEVATINIKNLKFTNQFKAKHARENTCINCIIKRDHKPINQLPTTVYQISFCFFQKPRTAIRIQAKTHSDQSREFTHHFSSAPGFLVWCTSTSYSTMIDSIS